MLLDGLMRVHEFEELIGADLKEPERADVATLSGLVMARLDRIPRVGDEVQVADRRLRVEQLQRHRVATIRLLPNSGSVAAETSGSSIVVYRWHDVAAVFPERAPRRLSRARRARAGRRADARGPRHAVRRIPAPLLAARRLRARPARRAAAPSRSWARTSCCSATGSAGSVSSSSIARTAGRRSSTASSPSAASGAATTAGSSTWTAASSRRRASPRRARSGTGSARARIPCSSSRGLVFAYMGPPGARPSSRSTTRSICRATRSSRRQVPASVQLAPDQGQQHGPGAHVVPPRHLERLPVHGGVRRARRARLGGDAVRHVLHRDPPHRRSRVGARRRLHGPERPPVHARDRGGQGGAHRRAGRWSSAGPCPSTTPTPGTWSWRRWTRRGASPRRRSRGRASASPTTGRTRSASGIRPTTTRSRASGRSPSTRSSTWPRRTAASSCCGRSCATASARSRPVAIRASSCGGPGPPIATVCQDTVLRIPPAPDAEADRRLLLETGRRVVHGRPA